MVIYFFFNSFYYKNNSIFIVKVGKCRKPLPPFYCRGTEEDVCIGDSECEGTKKCCSTGCMKQCTFPLLSMFFTFSIS